MNHQAVCTAITDDLALTWLHTQDAAFEVLAFAKHHSLRVRQVTGALVALERTGVVVQHRIYYPGPFVSGRPLLGVVLTRRGQCGWIHGRAAVLLPDSLSQLEAVKYLLRGGRSVSAQELEVQLTITRLRAHQLVLMLRALDVVHAAVDATGHFTDIRLRPQA